jgi:hypothetical protein
MPEHLWKRAQTQRALEHRTQPILARAASLSATLTPCDGTGWTRTAAAKDDELRQKIIATYGQARARTDSYDL